MEAGTLLHMSQGTGQLPITNYVEVEKASTKQTGVCVCQGAGADLLTDLDYQKEIGLGEDSWHTRSPGVLCCMPCAVVKISSRILQPFTGRTPEFFRI